MPFTGVSGLNTHEGEGGVYPWAVGDELERFQRPELSRPDLVLTPSDRPYPLLTSPHGKGAWPATDAAAGGDRAGLGWRGLLQRVRGLPSLGSPPAVGVDGDQARVS